MALLFFVFIQSCDKGEQDIYGPLCGSGSGYFSTTEITFELVDKSSRENLFTNGTFDPKDISVISLKDQSKVKFSFITKNDLNKIAISSPIDKVVTRHFSFQIKSKSIFELMLTIKEAPKRASCISLSKYSRELKILNAEFEEGVRYSDYIILVEVE